MGYLETAFRDATRLQREEPIARLVKAFDAHLEKLCPAIPFEEYINFEISKVVFLESGVTGYKFAMFYQGTGLTQDEAQVDAGRVVVSYLDFLLRLDPNTLDSGETCASESA